MSLVTKVLAGFPVVAGVATYPLALAANKGKELKVTTDILTPPPAVPVSQLIKKIVEEKNYEGCAELVNKIKWGPLWFVCASKEHLNKPSLYSYNRTREDRNLIVAHVTSITSSSSSPKREREMTLEKGIKEKIKFPPSWIHKLRGQSLTPESDCNFTENRKVNGGVTYRLICHSQVIQDEIEFENKTKK